MTFTFSGFHSVKAFTGAADHDRHDSDSSKWLRGAADRSMKLRKNFFRFLHLYLRAEARGQSVGPVVVQIGCLGFGAHEFGLNRYLPNYIKSDTTGPLGARASNGVMRTAWYLEETPSPRQPERLK